MMSENSLRPGDSNRIAREYIDSLLVETRWIGSREADTAFSLFGRTFSTPVMTGTLSHLNTFARPGGMIELAEGAAAAGAVMWMGMTEDEEAEKIARTGASVIEIIKPYKDRELIRHRLDLAADLGHLAAGIDIDMVYDAAGEERVFHGYPLQEITQDELYDLCDYSRIPFIVKGILSERDALTAAACGAAGLMVSHLGGTTEYAIPPLYALELISENEDFLKHPVPLFADGELRSGSDVFKAIACGACAAGIGRPLIAAIKENGAESVADYIRKTTAELKKMMISTGCGTLSEIDGSMLYIK